MRSADTAAINGPRAPTSQIAGALPWSSSSQVTAPWPSIQPLLATLGWTPASDRDTTYRSKDHHDIAAAEREQNLGRSRL